MEIGILGLGSSGKSTLFDLLTGKLGASQAARRGKAAVGMARVPDPRLEQLSEMYNPRRTTPAAIRFVDVPGIPEEHGREGSLNIPELRAMDVLVVVVRVFTDAAVPHPRGSVNPQRDLAYIEEELLIQDQMIVERRLERLAKDLSRRRTPELVAERQVMERCLSALEAERPLRGETFSDDELKVLRGFTFLSSKPLLVVVNQDEDDVGRDPGADPAWAVWQDRPATAVAGVCATLEAELAQLEAGDRAVFMDDLDLNEPAVDRVVREAYRLLGYISFFTVGDDECRAWSIRDGSPAMVAAAAIHSDIQRGFIRAEVVAHEYLLSTGSLAECRQLGSLRLEGKEYTVRDGDVVHFRFAV